MVQVNTTVGEFTERPFSLVLNFSLKIQWLLWIIQNKPYRWSIHLHHNTNANKWPNSLMERSSGEVSVFGCSKIAYMWEGFDYIPVKFNCTHLIISITLLWTVNNINTCNPATPLRQNLSCATVEHEPLRDDNDHGLKRKWNVCQ